MAPTPASLPCPKGGSGTAFALLLLTACLKSLRAIILDQTKCPSSSYPVSGSGNGGCFRKKCKTKDRYRVTHPWSGPASHKQLQAQEMA